jgi:hypothetical protein
MDDDLRPAHHAPRAARLAACALAAGLALAPGARATVYKCTDDTGAVVYQETPCPKGKELRNFDTDPPDITVLPAYTAPAPAPTPAPARAAAAPDKPARDPRTLQGDATPGKAAGDAGARRFVRQGMTEAEVLASIGRPDATAGGSRQQQTRWSYLPAEGDPDTVTTITFSAGTVSDVSRKVVKR